MLRIALGVLAIFFVINQFSELEFLYSDLGVLDRAHNKQILGEGFWSLMWFDGSAQFASIFLIVTGIVAAGFALGFQTLLMNIVLLVLIWSIQIRNPLVLTGGDVLLRMLLFWCLFLPTNSIWSIDSGLRGNEPSGWNAASVATLGIMAQVVFMYFFAGVAKLNPFWLSGDAVEYAMNLEMSVKPLGEWLKTHPRLLYGITLATIAAELLTLALMFVPRMHQFNRGMLLGFFLFMHVGIWLTMSIGLFSVTALVAWIIFVPSDIWNGFFGAPVGYGERKFYQPNIIWAEKLTAIVASVLLAYITVQNIALALGPQFAERTAALQYFGRSTMTIQQFHMFSAPPLYSPWFEYSAKLTSGTEVDVFFTDNHVAGKKPESVYAYMQSQNLRRIHWNLITHPEYPPRTELVYRAVRTRLLEHSVNQWNKANIDNPVLQAKLICHLDPIILNRDKPIQFESHETYKLIWATYKSK